VSSATRRRNARSCRFLLRPYRTWRPRERPRGETGVSDRSDAQFRWQSPSRSFHGRPSPKGTAAVAPKVRSRRAKRPDTHRRTPAPIVLRSAPRGRCAGGNARERQTAFSHSTDWFRRAALGTPQDPEPSAAPSGSLARPCRPWRLAVRMLDRKGSEHPGRRSRTSGRSGATPTSRIGRNRRRKVDRSRPPAPFCRIEPGGPIHGGEPVEAGRRYGQVPGGRPCRTAPSTSADRSPTLRCVHEHGCENHCVQQGQSAIKMQFLVYKTSIISQSIPPISTGFSTFSNILASFRLQDGVRFPWPEFARPVRHPVAPPRPFRASISMQVRQSKKSVRRPGVALCGATGVTLTCLVAQSKPENRMSRRPARRPQTGRSKIGPARGQS